MWQRDCLVENHRPEFSISETVLDMNEIECTRCGWNWIMFEGQTEGDCPVCPKELWGPVFVSKT
jgi:hypothetical protein